MSTHAGIHHCAGVFLATVTSRPPVLQMAESPALLRKVDALRALELFTDVAELDLRRLAEAALLRRYERGATIARAGAGDGCVILLEGRAKMAIPRGSACGEFALSLFDGGDIVLEGLGKDAPAIAAETVALERSMVMHLPRRALAAFLERNPRVALRFLVSTTAKLQRALALAAQNACLEVGDRLYRKLVDLSSSRGVSGAGFIRIEHGLHQSQLAANIGASREAVNRQLAAWRDDGLIEAGRGWVLVKDPLGLTMAVSQSVRDSVFGKNPDAE